jgi:hypothetical protein
MKINSDKVEITHEKSGQFQNVQCAKLDVYSESVTAFAPITKNIKDTLTMDRCWFKGITDPKEVRAKVLHDADGDPSKNGVHIQLPKINERPLELAGPLEK